MSGRTRRPATLAGAAALAFALATATPSSSQTVAAAPLGATDPWGVGWLGRADGALSATIWSDADAATLQPLFADLKPLALSPAGRAVLRRVLLSSARGPSGEPDLITERLRLLEQAGETGRSADLRRRFAKTPWGLSGDRLASDMDLVAGNNETGCARVAARRADDAVWMSMRALCLALTGNFDAAALAAEQAAAPDGKSDGWLLSALETMREPLKTRPAGRYGSAFEAAVSVAAGLAAPANAFAATPADVAAAVARHPAASADQKRGALRVAVDAGVLKPDEVLGVLDDIAESQKASSPAAGARSAQRPSADFLTLALAARQAGEAPAKAAAYAAALKAADNATDARIAALALNAAIKALPKSDATVLNAETFARASLLAGDVRQASEWRRLMDDLPADKADAWGAARIDLMLSYAAGDTKDAGSILNTLLDSLPAAPATPPKTLTPAQRQADLRRIENTRVLFLYVGTGRVLTPPARAVLATQRTAGRGVPDAALARIQAAAEGKAEGEALIAIVAQLGPDVSALSFAGLADLLTQLRGIGFDREANAIALEALQVWKAI